MKIIFILASILAATKSFPKQNCVEIDTDYKGRDFKTIHNVPDWHTCSKYCEDMKRCAKWTWVHPNFKRIPSARLECLLKSGARTLVYKEEHLVSGIKSVKCQF